MNWQKLSIFWYPRNPRGSLAVSPGEQWPRGENPTHGFFSFHIQLCCLGSLLFNCPPQRCLCWYIGPIGLFKIYIQYIQKMYEGRLRLISNLEGLNIVHGLKFLLSKFDWSYCNDREDRYSKTCFSNFESKCTYPLGSCDVTKTMHVSLQFLVKTNLK